MPMAAADGIEIAYEAWGDEAMPAVLLLPGAGQQLIDWEPDFIARITAGGYRIVAIDQRDTGLSTHFTEAGKAALLQIAGRPVPHRSQSQSGSSGSGLRPSGSAAAAAAPAYTLDDMAYDAVGVLDALDIDAAHVVGFSLGGAVAQQMAVLAGHRVTSLTSVMASTGNPDVGRPDPAAAVVLLRSPAPDRERAIAAAVEARRVGGTPGEFDEARTRARAARAYDRSFDPAGVGRQLAALWSAGDRTELLRAITVPTLVVHGSEDRLVGVSGGRATARAIPAARLAIIDGMGHDLPEPFVPRIVAKLLTHFEEAEPRPAGRESR